jgi:hypothetical protein
MADAIALIVVQFSSDRRVGLSTGAVVAAASSCSTATTVTQEDERVATKRNRSRVKNDGPTYSL